MMVKGIILDMDGVVVDSEPIHGKVVKQIFEQYGIDISQAEHETFIGGTSRAMWSTLKERFGLEVSVDELLKQDVEAYLKKLESLNHLTSIKGIIEILEMAQHKKITLCLASSATRANVNLVLQKLGIESYMEATVSGDEVNYSKPNPEIFINVAKKTEIKPTSFLVIEDSEHGVKAAKSAGMLCVGYQNANSGNQDLSQSDWIVHDLQKVQPIIVGMLEL